MDDVAQTIPTLDKIVSEIEGLAESGGKYAEAPHVIEVTLPMLCRFDTRHHFVFNELNQWRLPRISRSMELHDKLLVYDITHTRNFRKRVLITVVFFIPADAAKQFDVKRGSILVEDISS